MMTGRGSAIVLRLALIYAVLQPKSRRAHLIYPTHLRAALAVWNYCRESAELLFGSRSGTAIGDRILSLLANGPMKRNQFTDHIAHPAGKIDAALRSLEAAGRIRMTKKKPDGPGRPAEVWELCNTAIPNN